MQTWFPAHVWFARYDDRRELDDEDYAFMRVVRFALADFILPERHCGNCGVDISERPNNAIWCKRCKAEVLRERVRVAKQQAMARA